MVALEAPGAGEDQRCGDGTLDHQRGVVALDVEGNLAVCAVDFVEVIDLLDDGLEGGRGDGEGDRVCPFVKLCDVDFHACLLTEVAASVVRAGLP